MKKKVCRLIRLQQLGLHLIRQAETNKCKYKGKSQTGKTYTFNTYSDKAFIFRKMKLLRISKRSTQKKKKNQWGKPDLPL